jgi:hypothetical protein
MGGAHMGKMRKAYKTLVGKPEGNRLLGRPRHIWENNIKNKEIGCEDVDSIWFRIVSSGGLLWTS